MSGGDIFEPPHQFHNSAPDFAGIVTLCGRGALTAHLPFGVRHGFEIVNLLPR
jgi:hypothetical protein